MKHSGPERASCSEVPQEGKDIVSGKGILSHVSIPEQEETEKEGVQMCAIGQRGTHKRNVNPIIGTHHLLFSCHASK